MNYYKIIKHLYPQIQDSDFQLRDNSDGRGVYIHKWAYSGVSKPTLKSLEQYAAIVDQKRQVQDAAQVARKFLMETDYKIIQAIEAQVTDSALDALKQQRQAARLLLSTESDVTQNTTNL